MKKLVLVAAAISISQAALAVDEGQLKCDFSWRRASTDKTLLSQVTPLMPTQFVKIKDAHARIAFEDESALVLDGHKILAIGFVTPQDRFGITLSEEPIGEDGQTDHWRGGGTVSGVNGAKVGMKRDASLGFSAIPNSRTVVFVACEIIP